MLTFALAVFFLLITPGPGVLTTAGAGAAFGLRAGLAYMSGVVFGSLLVMAAVVTGLAAVVFSYPLLRSVLLVASLGYLLYVAFRVAAAGTRVGIIEAERPLGFLNGATLSVINPKAYAVMTTLFSGFAFRPDSPLLEIAGKVVVYIAIATPIHLVWLYAGASLKRLVLSAVAARRINVAMALAMLAVVALAAFSSDLPALIE